MTRLTVKIEAPESERTSGRGSEQYWKNKLAVQLRVLADRLYAGGGDVDFERDGVCVSFKIEPPRAPARAA